MRRRADLTRSRESKKRGPTIGPFDRRLWAIAYSSRYMTRPAFQVLGSVQALAIHGEVYMEVLV